MATFEQLYIKFEEGNQDSLDRAIKEAERLGYKERKCHNALQFEGNGILSLGIYGDYFTSVYREGELIKLSHTEHKIEHNIENNIENKEVYPDWVKRLAEEESRLQGKYRGSRFEKGTAGGQVREIIDWGSSRQGPEAWHKAMEGDYSLLEKRQLGNYKDEIGIGKTKKEIEAGLTNTAVPGFYTQLKYFVDISGTTTDCTAVSSNVMKSKQGADLLMERAKEQMKSRYFTQTQTNPLHNLFQ